MEHTTFTTKTVPLYFANTQNSRTVNVISFLIQNLFRNTHFAGIIMGIILLPSLLSSLPIGKNFGGSLYAQSISSVYLTDKGIMLPRVGLSSVTDILTVPSPPISFLLYNTATVGIPPNNISPGFYHWNGIKWIALGNTTTFSEFYALMPPDNTATIAAGIAIDFPQNGPTTGTIIRSNARQFILPAIGTYLVNFQVSISEPGQLVLQVNGIEDAATVVGRATGTSQIVGNTIITTTLPNSILSIVHPSGNTPALTLTPWAGGTHAVSATLVITRLQ
ncbi:MAG: hypothetical protein V4585_15300 [Bacteroidota bacterium]